MHDVKTMKIELKCRSHRRSKNNNRSKPLPTYQNTEKDSSSTSTESSTPRESGRLRRVEADEEQVYLIARNIHLTLHTLMINAK